jgi:hypothetical protein
MFIPESRVIKTKGIVPTETKHQATISIPKEG